MSNSWFVSSLITFNYFEFYSLSVGGIFPGESWSRASQFEISDEWVLIRNCFYYITQVSLSWNVSRTCSEYFTMHFIFWKPERVYLCDTFIFCIFFKGTQLLCGAQFAFHRKLVYPLFLCILDHIKHTRRLQGPKTNVVPSLDCIVSAHFFLLIFLLNENEV